MLHETHPYIKEFKTALEMLELTLIIRADRWPAGEHPRCFNAPTTNEVAAIVVREEYSKQDIALQHQDNWLPHISETHLSYDCFQYPLMFPYGEDSYMTKWHSTWWVDTSHQTWQPGTSLVSIVTKDWTWHSSWKWTAHSHHQSDSISCIQPSTWNNAYRILQIVCDWQICDNSILCWYSQILPMVQ